MPAARTETAPSGAAQPTRRARAFGLEIDVSFEAPGLLSAIGEPQGPRTRLYLATPEHIDRPFARGDVERVVEDRFDDGEPARTIDHHRDAGYRLFARHFGLASISTDGARVLCAPPEDEPWSWQRFLVGRVLPWAAVVRGYEAFHASAVAFGGRAVAFVGATGAGKTSLAIQLVARGGEFLTDDVMVLSRAGGDLLAHPGAAIASVRPGERAAITDDRWNALGEVLGESGKTYILLPRAERPCPLAAVYFLERGRGAAPEPIAPDPRLLLASTFVLGIQRPARLRNQLDLCAAIARGVPAFRLPVDPGAGAERLAASVRDHLVRVMGA